VIDPPSGGCDKTPVGVLCCRERRDEEFHEGAGGRLRRLAARKQGMRLDLTNIPVRKEPYHFAPLEFPLQARQRCDDDPQSSGRSINGDLGGGNREASIDLDRCALPFFAETQRLSATGPATMKSWAARSDGERGVPFDAM
jgi:hypothetical protein